MLCVCVLRLSLYGTSLFTRTVVISGHLITYITALVLHYSCKSYVIVYILLGP